MTSFALLSFLLAACAGTTEARPKDRFTLMTYNVNFGNRDLAASLDAIATADADVVLLQETNERWRDALRTRFAGQYPHHAYRIASRAAGGISVLSKLPITTEEQWDAPAGTGAWFPAQRLVIDTPLGAVQILNVHLRPAFDNGWIQGFLTTPPVRRAEIEAHWKRIDRALPTIVAGDFNEDDTGRAIDFLQGHGLARVPTTGHRPAASGSGTSLRSDPGLRTWHYEQLVDGKPTDLIKLDIDHVMLDGRLTGHDGKVLDAGTSDHRPVVVTIRRGSVAPP